MGGASTAGTQHQIGRAIGHDVGDVRIHTDSAADKMAQRIQASAFTVDRNIFFAAGEYRPDTDSGMHTLLHESGHLLEDGGQVRRAIRRKVSKTAFDLDMEFPQKSGPMAGLRKAVTPTGDISKLRQALVTYHARRGQAADRSRSRPKALKSLIKYADEWLRKHPKATSQEQRAASTSSTRSAPRPAWNSPNRKPRRSTSATHNRSRNEDRPRNRVRLASVATSGALGRIPRGSDEGRLLPTRGPGGSRASRRRPRGEW